MEARFRALLLTVLNSEELDEDIQVVAYKVLNQGHKPTDTEFAALVAVRLLGGPRKYAEILRRARSEDTA